MSSRVAMGGRDHHLVVPMAEWTPTAHEAPHPNTPLSSHVENHSKTTSKPRRSSPLAGPALSSDRSVVSLNETPDAPRTRSSLFISQDANRTPSTRPKSSSGLSRPTSIVSVNRPLPSQSPPRYSYSSRHRPSTAPTPSSKSLQGDIRTIGRPPSTLFSSNEPIRSERLLLSTSQGSRGVVSGSSFVGDNSGSRSRASHISTASAGSSTRPVSVVLEVETEEEDGGEDDAAQSRTSGILYPKSIPNPVAVAPVDNSWYVANEYSETPKFSRLGLAGSNVVMPVSAKELRKQLSRPGSSASLRSNISGGFPGSKGGSEWTGSPANDAGMSLANSSSSSTTSDSKEQSGMIKSSSSSISRDDPGSDGSPQKEHTTSRTHNKPEWLRPPQTYTRPRRAGMRSLSPSITSLPSPSPIFNSAASSASSLPLPTPPYSGMSSTPSVISCATAHTSVDDIQETIQEYRCQHCPKDTPPITLEKKLVKRKSVLSMMKSWRRTPQSAQRSKHPSSDLGLPLNDSSDEHGMLSVSSRPESNQSLERNPMVDIEPSKAHNVKKGSADIVVTSVPKSLSESTIQDIPGNGKRDKRVGSVRKIWNALTGRTSKP